MKGWLCAGALALAGCDDPSVHKAACPQHLGPDYDFSASPALTSVGGHDLLVLPQKSGIAFALSEFADFAVYTPLQRRQLTLAVVASSVAGLVVDSVTFLALAFGSLEFLAGQVVGKLWAGLVAIPLIGLLRRVAPTPA